MGGLMGELGKKLAERWLSLLVLPGALYVAIAGAAVTLGHRHALDVERLAREISDYAEAPKVTATGGQIVLLASVLAGSAALGVGAQALGSLLERLVLAAGWRRWPAPLRAIAQRLADRRRKRWLSAHEHSHAVHRQAMAPDPATRPAPADRHRALRRRERIAAERPDRPTWSGDRIHAAALRLDRDYQLNLAVLWPHLWLVVPDPVRNEIKQARTALDRATTLGAWAVLYLPLAIWWWPAILIAIVTAAAARHRVRAAADDYAQLLEATARLHTTTLAAQLGLIPSRSTGQDSDEVRSQLLDQALGRALSRHLDTRLPAPEAAGE